MSADLNPVPKLRGNSRRGSVVRERRVDERRLSQRRITERRLPLRDWDARWRSSVDIIGYSVEAADSAIGRIADFGVEEESLIVTEIVVVARRLLPGRSRFFVPLSAIERIDWRQRKVYVRPTREEIRRWSERECS
jgi:hypothetical protein